jgi:hypothetical protein
MSVPFWTRDVKVLFDQRHMFDIWPGSRTKSNEEKMNSISRFVIIYCILISLYQKSLLPMIVCMAILLLIIFMYQRIRKRSDPYQVNKVTNNVIQLFPGEFADTDRSDSKIFKSPMVSTVGSVAKPLHMQRSRSTGKGYQTSHLCRNTTKSNVFANPNITTIGSTMVPSCSKISRDYDDPFTQEFGHDTDGVYPSISRRHYYSVTENNQDKFANFLYNKA